MASTRTYGGNGTPVAEQSLGELVATATRDMSLLVHQEIELAKAELTATATTVGIGAGFFGGAGFFAFFALVLASFAGAFGFSEGLNIGVWAGFLCMTGVYLLLAGVLAMLGVSRMKGLSGPERTKAAVTETIAWVKHPETRLMTAAGARARLTGWQASDR